MCTHMYLCTHAYTCMYACVCIYICMLKLLNLPRGVAGGGGGQYMETSDCIGYLLGDS